MGSIQLIWLLLLPWSTQVHEFHSSIAEAEYKKETKSLQVSLRVFTDDFNLALKNHTGKDFDENFQSEEAFKAIQSYLIRHFAFVSTNKDVRLPEFLGSEMNIDATWLYFEIFDIENPANYQVYNKVLISEFDDQTNVVNIIQPGKRKSLIFTSTTTSLPYPFKD